MSKVTIQNENASQFREILIDVTFINKLQPN